MKRRSLSPLSRLQFQKEIGFYFLFQFFTVGFCFALIGLGKHFQRPGLQFLGIVLLVVQATLNFIFWFFQKALFQRRLMDIYPSSQPIRSFWIALFFVCPIFALGLTLFLAIKSKGSEETKVPFCFRWPALSGVVLMSLGCIPALIGFQTALRGFSITADPVYSPLRPTFEKVIQSEGIPWVKVAYWLGTPTSFYMTSVEDQVGVIQDVFEKSKSSHLNPVPEMLKQDTRINGVVNTVMMLAVAVQFHVAQKQIRPNQTETDLEVALDLLEDVASIFEDFSKKPAKDIQFNPILSFFPAGVTEQAYFYGAELWTSRRFMSTFDHHVTQIIANLQEKFQSQLALKSNPQSVRLSNLILRINHARL